MEDGGPLHAKESSPCHTCDPCLGCSVYTPLRSACELGSTLGHNTVGYPNHLSLLGGHALFVQRKTAISLKRRKAHNRISMLWLVGLIRTKCLRAILIVFGESFQQCACSKERNVSSCSFLRPVKTYVPVYQASVGSQLIEKFQFGKQT